VSLEQENFPARSRASSALARRPSRGISPAQIQPFARFAPLNSSRINTSEKFLVSRISLICYGFNSTKINTSGNKDLKSPGINTSGSKDLKPFRINTSKKQGRGGGVRSFFADSTSTKFREKRRENQQQKQIPHHRSRRARDRVRDDNFSGNGKNNGANQEIGTPGETLRRKSKSDREVPRRCARSG
jgi:hypothetical protein